MNVFQMTAQRRVEIEDWPEWLKDAWDRNAGTPGSLAPVSGVTASPDLALWTPEGMKCVSVGDWIIRSPDGALHVSKLIFRTTRDPSKNGTTIGRIWISEDAGTTWNNALWSLEDQIREITGKPVESWKIWGETAIPNGTYPVTVRYSEHFQRMMPHIEDVPGFLEIMFHGLNTAAQTHGCVGNAHNHPTEDTIQGDATADTIMPALARHGNVGTCIVEGPVAG